jgi:hypothetical protein
MRNDLVADAKLVYQTRLLGETIGAPNYRHRGRNLVAVKPAAKDTHVGYSLQALLCTCVFHAFYISGSLLLPLYVSCSARRNM